MLAPLRRVSPAYEREVESVFALVAYESPAESPLQNLVSDRERESVADLVNAAILLDAAAQCARRGHRGGDRWGLVIMLRVPATSACISPGGPGAVLTTNYTLRSCHSCVVVCVLLNSLDLAPRHCVQKGCSAAAVVAQRKAAADAAAAAHAANGFAGPSGGDVEMAVANGSSPAHAANGSASR